MHHKWFIRQAEGTEISQKNKANLVNNYSNRMREVFIKQNIQYYEDPPFLHQRDL